MTGADDRDRGSDRILARVADPSAEEIAEEPEAATISFETTETVKRTRGIINYKRSSDPIPLDEIGDPRRVQVLVEEIDYWKGQADEREEGIQALRRKVDDLTDRNAALDKRCAVAEKSLEYAHRGAAKDGLMAVVGSALLGASLSGAVAWPVGVAGGLLLSPPAFSWLRRGLTWFFERLKRARGSRAQ